MPLENCSERNQRDEKAMETIKDYPRTDVFAGGVERVEVVKVGESTVKYVLILLNNKCRITNKPKELGGSAHFISNYKAPLTGAFNFKDLHDRARTRFHIPHDLSIKCE